MRGSTREIEIKLPFDSASAARESLERLGASVLEQRQMEDNLLFDRPGEPLKSGGRVLRVRRLGTRTVLTFKAPVAGEHRHRVQEEHETGVESAAVVICILERLGFSRSWRYQKYRTTFGLGDLRLCVDETPLGCFVEIEGSPDEIDRTAALLGFEPARYVRESYRELHERAAGRKGEAAGDLLVDAPCAEPGA